MAGGKTVMQSIEAPGGTLCVDLFCRADGSWGFEEYRREPEDGRGWYPVGHHADGRYPDRAAALAAACRSVTWLSQCVP